MSLVFDEVPEWAFDVEEVSAGVYEVTAVSRRGQRVQFKGTDPDMLLTEARREALRLNQGKSH